ncbi:hypothetical protein psyc5s11_32190 [Clostridium gelidum]|uniref:Spermatogenesis-associated protein 20-like TRX domain-containing protein n=1 Tax=Clostridium gelidum TaxID=704125 RepID=A0ABN6IYJ3_9CLOT|nr:DUF255 domain-containing protein [Clostridium gelidum]BCZ47152.1 hypothetical protein psyc5s11_32190 [Clostridium gelidum]
MFSTVKANNLINEKYPYLLQHAHNPINWYAWSDEAFLKAKEEDKPIFLSIGCSTCHWCYVKNCIILKGGYLYMFRALFNIYYKVHIQSSMCIFCMY